jgi:hypothetical protein
VPEFWAGTDAGKAAHHCTVIDTDGTKALSRRVPNNEPELLELIGDVLALAEGSPVTWAVDLNAGGAALLKPCWQAMASGSSISPAALSTTHPAATGAMARRMPRTPTSSPTRRGCAGISSRCRSGTRSQWT